MRRIDRMKAIFLATPALAAALVLAGCAEDTSSVVVPKLVGMRGAAGQALLARRGLRSQWEQGARPDPGNAFFLPDTIVGQAPPPGRHVRRGTVVLLVPSSSKVASNDFAAQVAGRIQRSWRSALRAGAATDPAKRFPSPPRAWLSRRLREAEQRYGFHVVRVVMLRPRRLAPLVVIRASDRRALARATAAILRRLDPKRLTNDDRTGWAYEGFFFEAQDRRGVPFLLTFNSWRGPHAGGGQWAASEDLFPFAHG